MFEDQDLAASLLANPAAVQSLVLKEFQARLGGVYSVADANNSFNLLLEANSSMNAQAVRFMQSAFDGQYALRATTSAELYNHMSDFDYLSMVAGPSATTVNLTFDVDYLIANAEIYDSTYRRVILPINTQFYIGPLIFGFHYPINININQVTGNINVLWDTTTPNPLKALATNMVPFVQYGAGGLNLITLTIPVDQFAVAISTYSAVAQQGFIQKITYENQFYAARVFTNVVGGGWSELSSTLSETVYDPQSPTAKLTIENDINTITISIPQIYFTNGQIGNQVKILLYTTVGEVTLDLTSVEVASCNVDFGLNDPAVSQFSTILANLATIDLSPAEKTIAGGSNALSFEELRNLVINGGLYTSVPVTPAELLTYANKQGFKLTKYIDNVTDRVYYASNTIQGGQNGYIMVTTATVSVQPSLSVMPATILNFSAENAVTILPTTLYSFDTQSNLCTPLSDVDVAILGAMDKETLATELNTRRYTKCPFHLVTYTGSQYPLSKSFNLMNPTADVIRFIGDNVLLTPQMSVVSAAVIHKDNGTGGYTIRLGVIKTASMGAIAESDIAVYLSADDANHDKIYGIATFTGTSGVLSIYELDIPTSYYLTQQNTFRSTMKTVGQTVAVTVDIPLATTFSVTFLLTRSLYPNVAQDVNLISDLAVPYNEMLGVSRQEIDVVFGVDLSSQVFNNTNAVWSGLTYAVYPETVYQTYPDDVYATNALGGLIYTISGSTVNLTKLHSKGDQVLDSSGTPIVQYAAGSPKFDSTGKPIVMADRQLQFYVSTMMFDARLFYSESRSDVAFVANLTDMLMTYFATIATIQGNLLEQTRLYYQPNSTMGSAPFSSGNNIPLTLDLGFGFSFIAYVSQATLDSPSLMASMVADITTIVQSEVLKPVVSLTEISDTIRSKLADTILSIDVAGIDGTQSLQTVIVPSGTVSPIVGQKLLYDSDTDTLALGMDLKIDFVLAA